MTPAAAGLADKWVVPIGDRDEHVGGPEGGAQVAQQHPRGGVAPVGKSSMKSRTGFSWDAVRTKDATESARRYRSVSGSAFTGAGERRNDGPRQFGHDARQFPRTVAERLGWSRRPELADVVQDRLDEGLGRARPAFPRPGRRAAPWTAAKKKPAPRRGGSCRPRLAAKEDDLPAPPPHTASQTLASRARSFGPAAGSGTPRPSRKPGRRAAGPVGSKPRPVYNEAVDGFGDALQRERTDRRERDAGGAVPASHFTAAVAKISPARVGAAGVLACTTVILVAVLEPHVARLQPDVERVSRRLSWSLRLSTFLCT